MQADSGSYQVNTTSVADKKQAEAGFFEGFELSPAFSRTVTYTSALNNFQSHQPHAGKFIHYVNYITATCFGVAFSINSENFCVLSLHTMT